MSKNEYKMCKKCKKIDLEKTRKRLSGDSLHFFLTRLLYEDLKAEDFCVCKEGD